MIFNVKPSPYLLVVDDERVVLATLEMGLTRAGYSIGTAESVEEAEAALANKRPDLVILDVNLSGRNGLDLAEELSIDQIPFLMLSAYSEMETVERATQYGALGYLVKPVDTRQLIPAIEAALVRAEDISSLQATGQQLQSALDSEREISIAIGITMVKYRLDRKAAFELLRKTARNQRRKLTVLAAEIISASETLNFGNHGSID
jgi:response regulator NasT